MAASMDSFPQSRNAAFGQGSGANPAPVMSSLEQNVDPMFHPAGVISMYENLPSGIGQDPRTTGAQQTKQFGIPRSSPPPVSGSNQGSSPMNV
jgi:hypothetical protein